MDEFFSFDKAAKKVNLPSKTSDDQVEFAGIEDVDKSIMLYTHLLKGIKKNDDTAEALKAVLLYVRAPNGRCLSEEAIEWFANSLKDPEIWKHVDDFYWAFCVIHYKIMTELKLLDNLNHVVFNAEGGIKGVKGIYGRPDSLSGTMVGSIAGTLALAYFYENIEDYKETLGLIKDAKKLSPELEAHMEDWGHALIGYLTCMLCGGGVINFRKMARFCLKNEITPQSNSEDIYTTYMEDQLEG